MTALAPTPAELCRQAHDTHRALSRLWRERTETFLALVNLDRRAPAHLEPHQLAYLTGHGLLTPDGDVPNHVHDVLAAHTEGEGIYLRFTATA